MKSNYTLILFLFGISLLPKIYSDAFPSLKIIEKPPAYTYYVPTHKFHNKLIRHAFSHKSVFYACPEENATLHPEYALQIQGPLTDCEARPLKQLVKEPFVECNCPRRIKPFVFTVRDEKKDEFAPEKSLQFDIGFLIHKSDADMPSLHTDYKNWPESKEYDFIHFLIITMDTSLETIIWVRHSILSGQLVEPESDSGSSSGQKYEKNEDIYGFDVETLYAEESQRKIFSSISNEFYPQDYNYSNQCLIKVQLAPSEDFLLDAWKLASYVDLNTTAMWVQLYSQWKTIEDFVRKVARKLEALLVDTGTSKILHLPDAEGTRQPIYLRDGKTHPVSNYMWKLIKDDHSRAILIVMHNDPYSPDQVPICDDVSEEVGWLVSNNNYKTGLTYVCRVDENITSKLHDEFHQKYNVLDLNNLKKLKSEPDEEKVGVQLAYENGNMELE